MNMNRGDIFDRWTILRMKARFCEHARNDLARYEKEVGKLSNSVLEHFCDSGRISFMDAVAALAEANAKIWLVEAAIRKEHDNDPSASSCLSLEEVGRRALEIRGYNKLRVEAKQRIDGMFGDSPDVKVDHASE